ncbi:MAG: hypothetical protein HF978_13400 [Desulfobacteraceae bacterium]|nr:hypothetical protein [Desulfobacteraceae bacterium]MBC2756538.1 hypothetical protein [Desulfobacteraceae bacterium]
MKDYQKYTYWLDPEQFDKLEKKLVYNNVTISRSKRGVCSALSRHAEIEYITPEVWQKFKLCRRQLSWYFLSPFKGKYLIVSSVDLKPYDLTPETIIQSSTFRPSVLPKQKDRLLMKKSQTYLQKKPYEWDNFSKENILFSEQWLRKIGVRGVKFEELFVTHEANHANFIDPQFFITENSQVVPYSIDKTKHICSACLEFFNIIGRNFNKKFVVPCPGSVLMAGLPVNRYFEVTTPCSEN